METLRNFVVLEGIDGTGTSTQATLLRERLTASEGAGAWITAEPTGGPIGVLVRSALAGRTPLGPETVARLFAADRGEHLYGPGGVAERCGRGQLVVSDRYLLSSLAYQGLDCGDALPRKLNEDFPAPELTLFFDLDPREAVRRFSDREVKDIYENLEFQLRVRRRYETLLAEYVASGAAVLRIDASKGVQEVAESVWSALRTLPIMKT